MRHARGLITTAEALQQVFNISAKKPYRPAPCAGLGTTTTCSRAHHFSTSSPHPATYKPFVPRPETSFHCSGGRPFEPREVDPSKFGPKADRPPRDEEIRAWRAYVKLPNGRLSEPQSLQDILEERAKDVKGKYTQFVQELAPADPQNDRPYSVLGYFDKKEMKEQEVALKKKAKQASMKEKSLELGWIIVWYVLQLRLGRLKAFLEWGNKVEVVFGSTRIRGWGSKRKITEEEGKELSEKITRAALEVEGTKVLKELNGKLLGQASMSFQGPGKKEREARGGDEEIVEDS